MIRRQRIIYNYLHGFNNTIAVQVYNKGFTFGLIDASVEGIKQHIRSNFLMIFN